MNADPDPQPGPWCSSQSQFFASPRSLLTRFFVPQVCHTVRKWIQDFFYYLVVSKLFLIIFNYGKVNS